MRYQLNYQGITLSYHQYGHGTDTLLCFHGFGQHHGHFTKFATALDKKYTSYSFDLFYHGNSDWPGTEIPLEKKMWNNLLQQFLEKHQIGQFSLAGYSMGAKFVFTILESFAPRIDTIILMAPDGVKTSVFYSMATYPVWLRRYFKITVTQPAFYFKLVQIMGKLKLVDKGLIKFANSQMKTRKQRYKVYGSWVVFRKLTFDMKNVGQLISSHSIQLYLYLGKYDKIIRKENMRPLLRHLKQPHVKILNSGHNQLIDEVARHLSTEGIRTNK